MLEGTLLTVNYLKIKLLHFRKPESSILSFELLCSLSSTIIMKYFS